MNWNAIGAVGEIVGAAAVVVSLVYLAVQIRTQNREAKLAAMHEISAGFRDALRAFADENMATLFASANEDYDSLSDAKVIQLISGLYPILRVWEEAYIQSEQGRLDDRIWKAMNSQFSSYMTLPAMERVWNLRRGHFDQKFQEFVKQLESAEVKFR